MRGTNSDRRVLVQPTALQTLGSEFMRSLQRTCAASNAARVLRQVCGRRAPAARAAASLAASCAAAAQPAANRRFFADVQLRAGCPAGCSARRVATEGRASPSRSLCAGMSCAAAGPSLTACFPAEGKLILAGALRAALAARLAWPLQLPHRRPWAGLALVRPAGS